MVKKSNENLIKESEKIKNTANKRSKKIRKLILGSEEKKNKINQLLTKVKKNEKKILEYSDQIKYMQSRNKKLKQEIVYLETKQGKTEAKRSENNKKNKKVLVKNGSKIIDKKEMILLQSSGTNQISKVPILCYHSFDNNGKYSVTPYKFKQQMDYLHKNNYKVISLNELVRHIEYEIPFNQKVCVITIDDGYKTAYDVAFPILKKYNFPATLFIYTDNFIDISPGALTWEQIREMMKYNISIQAHSHTHPILTKRKKSENYKRYLRRIRWELEIPKIILENKLNTKVDYFAFPGGGYNNKITEMARKAGYRALFNVELGIPKITDDKYRLKRITVSSEYSMRIFKKLITKGTF